jgi:CRP/FNR family cyclic AMP-dependent transcriptional regulator
MSMNLYNIMNIFGDLFSISTKIRFNKYDAIFSKDEHADAFYIIMDGHINIFTDSKYNKKESDDLFKITTLINGGILGEMALFLGDHKRTVSAVSQTESTLLKISYSDFISYSKENQKPLMYLSKLMAIRLQKTTMRADNVVTNNVFDRVKFLLIELSENEETKESENSITFKVSKKEISQMIGCSRERAGKAINKLLNDKFITVRGKSITILKSNIKRL